MKEYSFSVKFDDGHFWLEEIDEEGEFHSEIFCWDMIQNTCEVDGWRLKYRRNKKRTWVYTSLFVKDIRASLDHIKDFLLRGDTVVMVAPNAQVEFWKDNS